MPFLKRAMPRHACRHAAMRVQVKHQWHVPLAFNAHGRRCCVYDGRRDEVLALSCKVLQIEAEFLIFRMCSSSNTLGADSVVITLPQEPRRVDLILGFVLATEAPAPAAIPRNLGRMVRKSTRRPSGFRWLPGPRCISVGMPMMPSPMAGKAGPQARIMEASSTGRNKSSAKASNSLCWSIRWLSEGSRYSSQPCIRQPAHMNLLMCSRLRVTVSRSATGIANRRPS